MKIVNPVGKKGEAIALAFLKAKGYNILETNFRKQYTEADIIALSPQKKHEDQSLIIIEVKTRTSTAFGQPIEAISPWKLRHLQKTALHYQITHPKLPKSLRIDAVCIILAGDIVKTIEHIENIS